MYNICNGVKTFMFTIMSICAAKTWPEFQWVNSESFGMRCNWRGVQWTGKVPLIH